jgi:hypothetical protein
MTVTITPTKLYAVALRKTASHSPHPASSAGIPLVDILRRAALLPRSNLVYHAICAQDTLSSRRPVGAYFHPLGSGGSIDHPHSLTVASVSRLVSGSRSVTTTIIIYHRHPHLPAIPSRSPACHWTPRATRLQPHRTVPAAASGVRRRPSTARPPR